MSVVSESRTTDAAALIAAARESLARNDAEDAVMHVVRALDGERTSTLLRAGIRVLYDAGDIRRAASLLDEFESSLGGRPGPADDKLIRRVRERNELLSWIARPRAARTTQPVERRVVNLLAYSLPYSSVGYAIRSHGLARAVRSAGWELLPYTRLGFPFDQVPELRGHDLPEEDVIDDVPYRRLLETRRRETDEMTYLRAAVDAYRRVLIETRPAVVHAASNHVTGLPALVAARQCGIPFVYEMRGFWEVTRSSADPSFASTATYRHIRLFETLVAKAADHVVTLTEGMKRDLAARGIPEERITVVPNGVDVERFSPQPRDRQLAASLGIGEDEPVVGYIGSFVDYEGLDDLIAAARILGARGRRFRLLLVGDGLELERVRGLIDELGLGNLAVLTGRVPHEQVQAYYSLIDVCAFPRKPWSVCELVSPLKPFEAMAQRKAVVVSDVTALREIVSDGKTGLVFEAGRAEALAEALDRTLGDALLRARLADAARDWVYTNRSWHSAAHELVDVYGRCR